VDPGLDLSSDPSSNAGSNPGSDPGSDPSSDPSSDPGSNPGSDPESDLGFSALFLVWSLHLCTMQSFLLHAAVSQGSTIKQN